MRKFITMLMVVCILASMLLLSSGCGVINKYFQSDTDSLAKEGQSNSSESKEMDAEQWLAECIAERDKRIDELNYSAFLKKLLRCGVNCYIQTPIDYQINYIWKDIDLDKINLSTYEKSGQSPTELLEAVNSGEMDDCFVSGWKGYFGESSGELVTLKSSKEMNAQYKIVYNDGHTGFVEENEVLLPKWLYYAEYLASSGEIKCSLEDMHRVLADEYILQKYMFLGLNYINNVESYKDYMPDAPISLAMAFAYYGLLDITKTKDMTIQVREYSNLLFGESEDTYELAVIGYFETPMDKIFESALTENEDYQNISTYMHFNKIMYLK